LNIEERDFYFQEEEGWRGPYCPPYGKKGAISNGKEEAIVTVLGEEEKNKSRETLKAFQIHEKKEGKSIAFPREERKSDLRGMPLQGEMGKNS